VPKKVNVDMYIRLTVVMENQDAHEVINELDYYFTSPDESVVIEDAEIVDMEITEVE